MKTNLLHDVIGGLTVGIMHVPQGRILAETVFCAYPSLNTYKPYSHSMNKETKRKMRLEQHDLRAHSHALQYRQHNRRGFFSGRCVSSKEDLNLEPAPAYKKSLALPALLNSHSRLLKVDVSFSPECLLMSSSERAIKAACITSLNFWPDSICF